MSDDAQPPEPGRRKDGQPYKEGNTRDDGSYQIGKYRPDDAHKFRVDDGRKRGRRAKGTKNLLTDYREELNAKINATEGGKTKRITKQRALVKSNIDRGIKKSDRAAETAMRYAELSEKRSPGLQADDFAIIEAWLDGIQKQGDSDDAEGNASPKSQADTFDRDSDGGSADA
jgi:hypothetical protein